jgi:Protein of unknown function (DUF1559)
MADDFDDDRPRRSRRTEPSEETGSGVKTAIIVVGIVALLGFCTVGGLVALVVYGAREISKSVTQSMAQMDAEIRYDAVAQAMLAYQSKHGHFPPPAMTTKSGKRGLSWRVAILPELGHDDLYKQFKIDLPWDDPENMRLAGSAPYQFLPPNASMGQDTHLRMFVGNGAMFEFGKKTVSGAPKAMDEIGVTDALSDTIMFVEATQPVLWIKPDHCRSTPPARCRHWGCRQTITSSCTRPTGWAARSPRP